MWPPSAIISSDVKDGSKAPLHQLARDFWLKQKQDENFDERCVVCQKQKTTLDSHFPLHSTDRDNAHQTNTKKARKKSQPTLIAKSAQSPLGCVDLLTF